MTVARLILQPTYLMRVFHVPEQVFEVDDEPDFVLTAQRFYLVWRSGFPEFKPRIEIDGNPEAARVLQRALFGKPRKAS